MRFLFIAITFPLATLLWWWFVADPKVRRWKALRWIVAAACAGNLFYFAHLFISRSSGDSSMTLWPIFHVWGYVWFLFTVPFLVFPWVTGALLVRAGKALWQGVRRLRSATLAEPDPSTASLPASPAPPDDTTPITSPKTSPPAAAPAPVVSSAAPVAAAAADAAAPESSSTPVESSVRALVRNQPLTRRELLTAASVVAPFVITGVASADALASMLDYRVRRFELPYPDLPPALDGFTIAHLSDLHSGRFIRPAQLERILAATNQLKPDLAVMTGDIIDRSLKDLPPALDMMKRIEARHGSWICEGNHDLFESRGEFERIVARSGVPILLNEGATLDVGAPGAAARVRLLGLRWGGVTSGVRGPQIAQNADRAFAHASGGDFSILLSHHPDAFNEARKARIPLTLAGHTHGGQMMLTNNIGGGPWVFDRWSGLYRQHDDGSGDALVVSNGVGDWMPLRINAPAEIIHITLRRGEIPPPGGQGSPTGARA